MGRRNSITVGAHAPSRAPTGSSGSSSRPVTYAQAAAGTAAGAPAIPLAAAAAGGGAANSRGPALVPEEETRLLNGRGDGDGDRADDGAQESEDEEEEVDEEALASLNQPNRCVRESGCESGAVL